MTVGSRKMDLVLASCFIFPLFLSQSCFADDTISQGQSIRFGQTIISPDESFALGFFGPSSSTNHYLGIWFYKLPVQTIVWVANRENPLTDSSGVLKLDGDGNLVVLDGNGSTIWSSNVSVSAINSTAKLLDSGNLVLIESKTSGKFFWESFNYPSDTFLPSMKFGLNLRTGENQLLKPWRNPKDPSTGNFSLGFDPRGLAQIVIWQGSEIYWRSGLWNGQGFIGVPEMSSFYLYNFNVITDVEQGRLYCTYTDTNKSQFSRFLVDPSGQLQRLYWVPDYNEWVVVWSQPKNQCELYNFCGINGSCNRNSFPVCSCLFGFEPKSPKDWAMGNWSGGCERRTRLQCEKNSSGSLNGKGDGFFKLPGMKLPDSSNWLAVDKTDVCRDNCLKNCSCVAVSYEAGLGCMYWSDDLVDLQIFPNGGQDLYFRLADSEIDTYLSDNGGKKKRILVIIIVLVILGTIVLVILAYFMCRFISKQRARWKCKRHGHKLVALELGAEVEAFTDNLDTNKIKESVRKGKDLESPLFDLCTILAATDNFSTANKLGEGGFGPVYKGKLPEGQEIAVKRLSRSSGQGLVEFENEVVLIAKLQHRNLVRLLGYCIQGEEKLLIYEYMPHKSLDAFLFDRTKREQLDWRKRIHIIEGIARGLLYLHRDSRLTIIHRDLKASNILLDGEMNPKISDFGMARIFGDNQEQGNTNRVVGTYGYMAPEYAMEGLFSEKSDIYSFGVLLLEVMSGKKNTSFYSYGQSLNLLGYAWQLWKADKELDLMDHSLSGSFPEREASRCINVGLLCVQECAEDRPAISSVVFMLGNEATTLPSPKQPAFSVGRSARETTISSIGSYSINDLTISIVEGR